MRKEDLLSSFNIMNNVVDLNTYRNLNLEEEYLKFYSYVRKYMRIPTNVPELARDFYFILRFLEGSMNCLESLSLAKRLPENEVEEMKQMIYGFLDQISDDLKQY